MLKMADDIAYTPYQLPDEKYNTPQQEQKDYYPSWIEFAAKKRSEIVLADTKSGAGSTTLYTVPEGYTLYLTNLYLSVVQVSTAGVAGTQGAYVSVKNSNFKLLYLNLRAESAAVNQNPVALSQNFSMPVKIESGVTVNLTGVGANCFSAAGFIGFLEPNPVS